ncbi:MAG: DNA topoisomerase (ATP-hydrolyzing) subunit B [Candidatus ainarchaeum sp.]|nr:DNA topoisomerase (ATP-hydrolyzing) subunit B [Candidatus ainarchaeum sp.]
MPGKEADYNADSIQVLEGLAGVRKRPSMYIGSTSERGLHHLVYEVVDNSIDEALAGYAKNIEVTLSKDGSATVVDDGRGIPVDVMPKYGVSALEVVMSKLHAGGKFGASAYKVSGGLHGVGVSAVNALSETFEVLVEINGKKYFQRYERGEKKTEVIPVGPTNRRGTTVRFKPDSTIFSVTEFQFGIIADRLKELAYLNKGVRLTLRDERVEPVQEAVYEFEGGIVQFVKDLNKDKATFHEPIYVEKQVGQVAVELALQYNDSFVETLCSFVNDINTIEGGTHVAGFRAALTRVANDFARSLKVLKEGDETKLSGDDVREGLTVVLSVKIPQPQFEGQTKTKLGNSEIKGLVESVVSEGLSTYYEEHPAQAKAILEKCILALEARDAARKARDLIRRKSALESGTLPGKLADCSEKDPNVAELFLVEGDSAGGCFSGETRVALLDARHLSFKELVEEDMRGKKNYCYTVKGDGSIGVGLIRNPRLTQRNAEVVKLALDNGEEIVCTPGHPFMLREGGYCRADRLGDGKRLMSLMQALVAREGGGVEETTALNHRVINVSPAVEKMDVYDLEVEGTHNFALASGVFVHNSAKQGRDRRFQAILPLRGKILNVEKAAFNKVLENAEIQAMICALGTGIREEFDLQKARYHKLIIMCDADVDGSHIRTLILTFLYRYMKPLIEAGYVYIAQPPIYKLKKGKFEEYLYDEALLEPALSRIGRDGASAQRYKGLGEMNPGQLWETTMDPEKRMLLRVTMQDAVAADNMFTILMGDQVEPRRAFIEAHAKEVKNLDV